MLENEVGKTDIEMNNFKTKIFSVNLFSDVNFSTMQLFICFRLCCGGIRLRENCYSGVPCPEKHL